jgi:hypothetical protein
MFKALPPGSQIATEPRFIVSLRRSTNTIVLPMGGQTAVVRASIVGLCTRQGLYEVYVFLGSADAEGRGVAEGTLFRCDPAELDLTGYEKKLVEAVQMVEQQGFSVARVEFRSSPEAQKQALQSILPFAPVVPRQSGAFPALGAVPRASGSISALPSNATPLNPATRVTGNTSVIPQDRLEEPVTLGSGSFPRPLVAVPRAAEAKTQATDVLGTLLSLL